MKKKNYSYLLVMAFVLVTVVLISPNISAEETITFVPKVDPVGSGEVTVKPAPPYTIGQVILLTATVDERFQFTEWLDTLPGGASGSDNPLELTVSGNHDITAKFTKICFSLTTTSVPGDGGTISRSNPGDDGCPVGTYKKNTPVILTATPVKGYDFSYWTKDGALDPEESPSLTVTMDDDHTVTAGFTKGCRLLSLSRNPKDAGNATSISPSVDCTTDFYYKLGEQITLTANPIEGWKVIGWTKQIDSGEIVPVPPAAPPNENKYSFSMPGVATLLKVGVNFEKMSTFGFKNATQEVSEDAGMVTIAVAWDDNTPPAAPTFYINTRDGSAQKDKDYNKVKDAELSFKENEVEKTFSLKIIDNNIADGDRYFYVDLSLKDDDSDVFLSTATIIVTITDEDGNPTIRFEDPPYQVDESTSSILVPVIVKPLPLGVDEVFVNFSTENGTATAGQDYEGVENRTLRIPIIGQEARATTRITISQDDLDEADETILLNLSNPYPTNVDVGLQATLTILDDDDSPEVGFSESEYFIKQESRISTLVPILLSEESGQEIKIDYAITLERTGSTTGGILTIPAGSTGTALDVDIASAVPGDVFSLQLSNPQNAKLGLINSARLYVLDTDINDCRTLTLTFSGYGQAPTTTTKTSSLGCPAGQFVSGELVEITAQPERGWYVSAWFGTIDDESTSLQNAVQMPDKDLSVNADYRVPVFFSVVGSPPEQWSGPDEEEPNNLFSEANGPLQVARDYFGGFPDDGDKEDRYYFELDAAGNATITLRDIPEGTDYDIYLYPEEWSKGEIASSREFDNRPEEIKILLDAGKYYIRVLAGNSKSSSEKYRLRVEIN